VVRGCALIKLIGIDVDGTLLDSEGRLPDENVAAIEEAVGAGIHVALVTGRSFPWAHPVAKRLPPTATLIVSNGAIERAHDGTTLWRRLLPTAVAALIFDRDAAGQIVFESMDWAHPARHGYFERNRGLIEHAATLEEALSEDPIQVMFNGGVEEMRTLAAALAPAGDFAVSVTEYKDRDFTLVDVTSTEATKGQGLARRAAALGLQRDEVMAVGDNFNDIGMLESVGLPVVMGNAVAELKSRGWAVTGHQNEAGLAQAVRRFALG
jgi:Cof subfamily protein (haloacid dehalogenase superfamily)